MLGYTTELHLYPDVISWLNTFLHTRFPKAEVDVRDTHAMNLNAFVLRNGFHHYFESDVWRTFEIKVDITGFLVVRGRPGTIFVECKNRSMSLRDVSQLLGYCRVAKPLSAYLVSPYGAGNAVRTLILEHDRADLLEYDWPRGRPPRYITIAKWDRVHKGLDALSLLPPQALGAFGGI